MKGIALIGIAASAMILLAGCGGGSSDSSVQGSSGSVGSAPVTPVTPMPDPITKPDFTDYLTTLIGTPESDEPAATDDLEFVFADEDDDTVFAALLEPM